MPIIRLARQLDGSSTESANCGPSVAIMEVAYQTANAIRPTADQIRTRMANPSGYTTSADRKKAIESYDTEAKRKGYRPLRYRLVTSAPVEDLWTLMERGRPVGATISYGVVAEQAPRLWASRTFRGRHIIWLRRGEIRGGQRMVKVFDPLADGRFSGIPNGPQWWPWWLVRDALAAVHGSGKWGGGVSAPPRLLSVPEPPEPEPVDPPDEPDPLEALLIARQALVTIGGLAAEAVAAADAVYPPSTSTAEPDEGAGPEA